MFSLSNIYENRSIWFFGSEDSVSENETSSRGFEYSSFGDYYLNYVMNDHKVDVPKDKMAHMFHRTLKPQLLSKLEQIE